MWIAIHCLGVGDLESTQAKSANRIAKNWEMNIHYKYGISVLASLNSEVKPEQELEEMEIPIINLKELDGEKRSKTMSLLHEACAQWGFFWIENHNIDDQLMEKIKRLVNQQYEESLKNSFYELELAKGLGPHSNANDVDWESSFFYIHQPNANIDEIPEILRETLKEYVDEVVKLAEKLAEAISENLGLKKNYLKNAFCKSSVGTKVAKYPKCSQPDIVMGLRDHTDAGGIILLLQDDKVPGLEFFKDGEWVPITPMEGHRIFVNLGDQVEVISNGTYKSIKHHVLATENGSRLSIATFYNPGGDAVISPARELVYPGQYTFQDYLNYYSTTKFSDKSARLQKMRQMFP